MPEHKRDATELQMHLLNAVKDFVTELAYDEWFSDLTIEEISGDGTIILGTATEMQRAWLYAIYQKMVSALLKDIIHAHCEVFFVVRRSGADNSNNASGIKLCPDAFSFLFKGMNNEYDNEYASYIEGSNDLQAQAVSENGDLNIAQCVFCGNSHVPNVDLDIELQSRNNMIKSIKIRGAKCSKCGEEYYGMEEIEVIKEIKKMLGILYPPIE